MERKEGKSKALKFYSSIGYYIVVIALIASIVFMYGTWKKRSAQYDQLVQQASVDDQGYMIELQKKRDKTEETVDAESEDTIKEIEEGKEDKED